jgi:DNA-binding NarL/FixJ family response regulator
LDFDPEFVRVHLSPREAEVLGLYASGETAERVAALLFISRDTVLDHIRRVRTKYAQVDRAAPTKVDLYRRAVEDGLIPPADDVGA